MLVIIKYDDKWPINFRYPIVNLIHQVVPKECCENMVERGLSHNCGMRGHRYELHAFTVDAIGSKVFDDAISWEDIDQCLV